MTSFYYYDQNPSGFCFLVQTSGITKLKYVYNDAIVQMVYLTELYLSCN